MRGFPKHFNSKKDVEVCQKHWPQRTKQVMEKMKDERMQWVNVKKLKSSELGTKDKASRVLEVKDEKGEVVERYQQEFREDPQAKLCRLGLTVEDAEKVIEST